MTERLQKFLARAGVASRRHAEGLITAGRVSVNNQRVTELGTKVEPTDLVTVDGKLVAAPERTSWYLLHKPPGVVTTLSDPEGRPTVAGLLEGVEQRVFPVGRLDWDAEGALLLTNDGGAAHRLLHPSFEVPRTYLAKVKGTPTDGTLARLLEGVRLEDGPARALRAERFEATERNTWLLLQVGEGRPHLVKRLCAAVGHPVVRLFRPAQAGVSVAGLQPGELRPLTSDEVQRVEAVAAGGTVPEPSPFLPPRRHGRTGEDDEPLEGGEGVQATGEATHPGGGEDRSGGFPHSRRPAQARSKASGPRPPRQRPAAWPPSRGSGPGPGRRGFGPGGDRPGHRGREEGGFRPRDRDTGRGGRGASIAGDFRPRGRAAERGRGAQPRSTPGGAEGGFRPRGRGAARAGPPGEFRPRVGGAERAQGGPRGGFGAGRDGARAGRGGASSAGAGERGFRPRDRDAGRGSRGGPRGGFGAGRDAARTGRGGAWSAGAGEGGFRPRGRDAGRGGRGGPRGAPGARTPSGRGASGGDGGWGTGGAPPRAGGGSRGGRASPGSGNARGRGRFGALPRGGGARRPRPGPRGGGGGGRGGGRR